MKQNQYICLKNTTEMPSEITQGNMLDTLLKFALLLLSIGI